MRILVSCSVYTPSVSLPFWCDHCDKELVDADRPETGKFFQQFGTQLQLGQLEPDGDYHSVIFAVCASCLSAQV